MAKKSSGFVIPDRVPLEDVMATGPEGAVSLDQAVGLSQPGALDSVWAEDPQSEAVDAMQLAPSPEPVINPAAESPAYEAPEEPTEAIATEEITALPATDEEIFDPVLLEAAGLTAEEAQAQFKSPAALANAVRLLDTRYIQAGEDFARQPQPSVSDASGSGQVDNEYQLPKPVESEDWTEDVKALIQSLQDHQKQQLGRRDTELQKQREQLEALLAQQSERERLSYVERLDSFVNSLGDEWAPILGKGSGFQLPANSLALQNRIHLDVIAGKLASGRNKYGQPDLRPHDLYVRALHAAFPDQVVRTVRQDVTRQLESRQRQFTAKPTQKQGRQLSGVDQAISHAEDWYRSKGPILDDGNDEI